MLDFDELEDLEEESGTRLWETEEEREAREAAARFKEELDAEHVALLRAGDLVPRHLSKKETTLGVLFVISVKGEEASDPDARSEMFFCDAVNAALRKLFGLLAQERHRLASAGGDGYNTRVEAIAAFLNVLVQKEFYPWAAEPFEKIAEHFRGPRGLLNLMKAWLAKGTSERKASELKKAVDSLLKAILEAVWELHESIPWGQPWEKEAFAFFYSNLRHVLEAEFTAQSESSVPEWLQFWRTRSHHKILKVTHVTASNLLYELRESFKDPEFLYTYQELRVTAKQGNKAHMKMLDMTWNVQKELLPRYGYDANVKGLQEMRNDMLYFAGPKVFEYHPEEAFWQPDHAAWKMRRDIHLILDMGMPVPRLPTVRPLSVHRFPFEETESWLKHLSDEGFVVISGAVTHDEVGHAYQLLWDFIEKSDSSGSVSRQSVSTWLDNEAKGAGWPAGKEDGIIHTRGIGQSPILWYLRSRPNLRQIFAGIWGTPHLVTSFDGAGVFRPYGHSEDFKIKKTRQGWCHVDQAHTKPGLHCVQGMVTLKDATEKTGGLVVVPRSHRFFASHILKTYQRKPDGWDFIEIRADDPVLTQDGRCPSLVCAKSGDVLLWDSRTIHCNTPPLVEDQALLNGQDLIRAVAYICMTPAAWCSPEALEARGKAFDRGVTTSHWPHEYHSMHVHGHHPGFRLSHEMQELVCPQAVSHFWHGSDAHKRAPEKGRISLVGEASFVVASEHGYLNSSIDDGGHGVPVRSVPSDEIGSEIGRLPKDDLVGGHVFGRWLRLSAWPGERFSIKQGEEAWVPIRHPLLNDYELLRPSHPPAAGSSECRGAAPPD